MHDFKDVPQKPGNSSMEKLLVKKGVNLQSLKKFDMYSNVAEDDSIRTSSGAILSIGGWVIIALLILAEVSSYFSLQTTEHLKVDTSLGLKLHIDLDISFHALTCAEVHLDAMDIAGDNQVDLNEDLQKRRLSANGEFIGSAVVSSMGKPGEGKTVGEVVLPDDYCGSCYGAENNGVKCCNNCDELKIAYQMKGWSVSPLLRTAEQCMRDKSNPFAMVEKGEGCRITGSLEVNKVAGNVHVAHGDSIIRDGRHIHQFVPQEAPSFNISHTIHSLGFGKQFAHMKKNPMDGIVRIVSPEIGTGLFQYFVKIVPTEYSDSWGTYNTNTYTMTERFRPVMLPMISGKKQSQDTTVLPGLFIIYDLSPFLTEVARKPVPFSHFISRICAVVGGVYALIGVLDANLYRLEKLLKKDVSSS